jgi:hypothetical protein
LRSDIRSEWKGTPRETSVPSPEFALVQGEKCSSQQQLGQKQVNRNKVKSFAAVRVELVALVYSAPHYTLYESCVSFNSFHSLFMTSISVFSNGMKKFLQNFVKKIKSNGKFIILFHDNSS